MVALTGRQLSKPPPPRKISSQPGGDWLQPRNDIRSMVGGNEVANLRHAQINDGNAGEN